MEKQLKAYIVLMTALVAEIAVEREPSRLRLLRDFHSAQVVAFQHERLIHLLVTFFFAALFLCLMICVRVWPIWEFLAVAGIVLVTLSFYIKHYFFLENTIQKLYPITETLFRLSDETVKEGAREISAERDVAR
ncbi:MAG: hypothetical protein LBV45_01835 [Xanthomonadaceae bacterium]|jgi:hypothetical protein|nr:hypothetical protein [Xanthomonadaceae bacterium]